MNKKRMYILVVIICMLTIMALLCVCCTVNSYADNESVDVSIYINNQQYIMDKAHEMADCARALDLPENCETIQKAGVLWTHANYVKQALLIVATMPEQDVYYLSKTMKAEANGSPTAEVAGVAWCILNRLDNGNYGSCIGEVATMPNQFAYYSSSDATTYYKLALDVLIRWNMEKLGCKDAGRVLPSDYMWFTGDGKHNYFRNTYKGTGKYWDWSLPNPYIEGSLCTTIVM